ncbi:MAG: hypothetical protein NTW50_03075 [Candidatus Berkelbacteria bacterium]|nr:hypothetical protein [Candidatus Berkelbacteria bacterium]
MDPKNPNLRFTAEGLNDLSLKLESADPADVGSVAKELQSYIAAMPVSEKKRYEDDFLGKTEGDIAEAKTESSISEIDEEAALGHEGGDDLAAVSNTGSKSNKSRDDFEAALGQLSTKGGGAAKFDQLPDNDKKPVEETPVAEKSEIGDSLNSLKSMIDRYNELASQLPEPKPGEVTDEELRAATSKDLATVRFRQKLNAKEASPEIEKLKAQITKDFDKIVKSNHEIQKINDILILVKDISFRRELRDTVHKVWHERNREHFKKAISKRKAEPKAETKKEIIPESEAAKVLSKSGENTLPASQSYQSILDNVDKQIGTDAGASTVADSTTLSELDNLTNLMETKKDTSPSSSTPVADEAGADADEELQVDSANQKLPAAVDEEDVKIVEGLEPPVDEKMDADPLSSRKVVPLAEAEDKTVEFPAPGPAQIAKSGLNELIVSEEIDDDNTASAPVDNTAPVPVPEIPVESEIMKEKVEDLAAEVPKIETPKPETPVVVVEEAKTETAPANPVADEKTPDQPTEEVTDDAKLLGDAMKNHSSVCDLNITTADTSALAKMMPGQLKKEEKKKD